MIASIPTNKASCFPQLPNISKLMAFALKKKDSKYSPQSFKPKQTQPYDSTSPVTPNPTIRSTMSFYDENSSTISKSKKETGEAIYISQTPHSENLLKKQSLQMGLSPHAYPESKEPVPPLLTQPTIQYNEHQSIKRNPIGMNQPMGKTTRNQEYKIPVGCQFQQEYTHTAVYSYQRSQQPLALNICHPSPLQPQYVEVKSTYSSPNKHPLGWESNQSSPQKPTQYVQLLGSSVGAQPYQTNINMYPSPNNHPLGWESNQSSPQKPTQYVQLLGSSVGAQPYQTNINMYPSPNNHPLGWESNQSSPQKPTQYVPIGAKLYQTEICKGNPPSQNIEIQPRRILDKELTNLNLRQQSIQSIPGTDKSVMHRQAYPNLPYYQDYNDYPTQSINIQQTHNTPAKQHNELNQINNNLNTLTNIKKIPINAASTLRAQTNCSPNSEQKYNERQFTIYDVYGEQSINFLSKKEEIPNDVKPQGPEEESQGGDRSTTKSSWLGLDELFNQLDNILGINVNQAPHDNRETNHQARPKVLVTKKMWSKHT